MIHRGENAIEEVFGVEAAARNPNRRRHQDEQDNDEEDEEDSAEDHHHHHQQHDASTQRQHNARLLGSSRTKKMALSAIQKNASGYGQVLEWSFAALNGSSEEQQQQQDNGMDADNKKHRMSMRSSRARRVCRLLMKVEKLPSSASATQSPPPTLLNVHLTPIEQHVDFDNLCDFQFMTKERAKSTTDPNPSNFLQLVPSSFAPITNTGSAHTVGVPSHVSRKHARGYDRSLPGGVFDYRFESKPSKKVYKQVPFFHCKSDQEKPKYFTGLRCDNVKAPRKEVPKSIDPAEQVLRETIGRMFEKRPIWKRRAIAAQLGTHPFVSDFRIRNQLLYFAYVIKDGPYKHLLVKYGVDPKNSVEFAKYQNLKFNLPKALREFVEEGSEQRTNLIFSGVPQQWVTSYCLCDIRLKKVVKLVQNTRKLHRYTKANGFFEKSDLNQIRKWMKEKSAEYINAMEQDPTWTPPVDDADLYYSDPFHPDIEDGEFDITDQLNKIDSHLELREEEAENEVDGTEQEEDDDEDDDEVDDEGQGNNEALRDWDSTRDL